MFDVLTEQIQTPGL